MLNGIASNSVHAQQQKARRVWKVITVSLQIPVHWNPSEMAAYCRSLFDSFTQLQDLSTQGAVWQLSSNKVNKGFGASEKECLKSFLIFLLFITCHQAGEVMKAASLSFLCVPGAVHRMKESMKKPWQLASIKYHPDFFHWWHFWQGILFQVDGFTDTYIVIWVKRQISIGGNRASFVHKDDQAISFLYHDIARTYSFHSSLEIHRHFVQMPKCRRYNRDRTCQGLITTWILHTCLWTCNIFAHELTGTHSESVTFTKSWLCGNHLRHLKQHWVFLRLLSPHSDHLAMLNHASPIGCSKSLGASRNVTWFFGYFIVYVSVFLSRNNMVQN